MTTAELTHGIESVSLSPVQVTCLCGAKFDAYGNRGALNKMREHMESLGLSFDVSQAIRSA